MGLWQLAEHYPKFLGLAPRDALDALLKITDEYVRTEHKPADSNVPVMLDDRQTGLLRDYSSIWAGAFPRNTTTRSECSMHSRTTWNGSWTPA